MRLLAVSPSGDRGGAETMLLRAVQAAVARGWEVSAVAPTGPLHDDLAQAGARVSPAPVLRLAGGSRLA